MICDLHNYLSEPYLALRTCLFLFLKIFIGFFDFFSCLLTFAITYSEPYLALQTCLLLWNISGFNAASADFHQANLEGIQSSGVEGHLLDDGTFIFVWFDGNNKKMVQTTNKGQTIKAGYLGISSESWKDPSTWTDNGVFYRIENFKGKRGWWTSLSQKIW